MLRESSKILAKAVENGSICFSGGAYFLPGSEIRPEELLEKAKILKDSNTTTCGLVSGIFVKRYNKRKLWKTLKRLLGYPRAYRCLAASLSLESASLLTPRVLYASRYYLVTETLPEEETVFLSEEPELVRGFFPALARLHEAGIIHGDLSIRNIYFDKTSSRYGFIDLDGAAFGGKGLSPEIRRKEVARVLSSYWFMQDHYGKKLQLADVVEEFLPLYEKASGMSFSRQNLLEEARHFLEK